MEAGEDGECGLGAVPPVAKELDCELVRAAILLLYLAV